MAKSDTKNSNIERRRREAIKSGDAAYIQRRKDLLNVAGRLFREKGYDNTSVNDLAMAIGIDRATLYYYTSGKEELFQEMVLEVAVANADMAEAILASDAHTREKIQNFIVSLMKSYEDNYPYLHVYVQEFMTKVESAETDWSEHMRQLAQRFNAATVGIIQEGLDNGTVRSESGSANMISNAMIGMCNWSHRWFFPDGKQDAESIGLVFSNIVVNGICK